MLNHILHQIGLIVLLLVCATLAHSQDMATISGRLVDPDGKPAEAVAISVMGLPGG
ncbi:MAG: hypothetical protein JKX74_01635, partial [Flavobacteriales bacterium]|nr:hypothetical protein [Flavobacteriales bacterium]